MSKFEEEHGIAGGRGKKIVADLHAKKKLLAEKMKTKHHGIKNLVKHSTKSPEETSRLAHKAFNRKPYEKDEPEMGGKLK